MAVRQTSESSLAPEKASPSGVTSSTTGGGLGARLTLQRTAGNRATSRVVGAQQAVGRADHPAEQEAGHVATAVMRVLNDDHGEAITQRPAPAGQVLPVRRRTQAARAVPAIRHSDTDGSIRRAIVPVQSPETTEDVATLKGYYNAAWDELWKSDSARKIYQFVHQLKGETKIEVGAASSDAEPGRVRWNPSEKNVLLNKTQAEIGVGTGGAIAEEDIVGQSSAAVTLIHELGHLRQHHEATAVVEEIKAKHEGIATTKIPNLAELIKLIDDQAVSVDKDIVKGDATQIIEDDNVTRHERPAAAELGESRRNEYKSGMGNADEYEQYFTAEAWELVQRVQAEGTSWTSDNEDLGTEATRTAVGHIETQLKAMKTAAAKITGWKKANATKAVAIVEDILNGLKECDTKWSAMVEDVDLTKPRW